MAEDISGAAPAAGGESGGEAAESTSPETPETPEIETGAPAETPESPPEEATDGEPQADAPPAEGEEAPEETEDPGIELNDDTVLKIGDTEHSFGEIREAIELVGEARTKIEEANGAIERSNGVLDALREKPADALMGIFTSVFDGDRQKGYQATVQLAAQIINRHNELEKMPPGERKALTLEQELQEAKHKLQSFESEQKAKQDLELENKWTGAITDALKLAGLPTSYMNRVAGKLAEGARGGKKISMSAAVDQVKAELKAERAELLKTVQEDEIPEEIAQKLAQKRIDAAKKRRGLPVGAPSEPAEDPQKKDDTIVYDPAKFLETFARVK